MSRKKTLLTVAEHQAIGDTLYRMRGTLSSIILWAGNTYRKDRIRPLIVIEKHINRLRSKLDDAVCREFPRLPDAEVVQVYYPVAVRPLDTSGVAWDVPTACDTFRQWASDLRTIANQLFQAYPVAIGDLANRCADRLAFEAIELPYHLGLHRYGRA